MHVNIFHVKILSQHKVLLEEKSASNICSAVTLWQLSPGGGIWHTHLSDVEIIDVITYPSTLKDLHEGWVLSELVVLGFQLPLVVGRLDLDS